LKRRTGRVYPPGSQRAKGSLASTLELALAAAACAGAKKAQDIVVLDMRGLVDYTDYLVVCNGQTPRQTKAIAEEVRTRLKQDHGAIARRVEGEREGEWILIDLLDVVVHVFTPQAREFYRLDRLWRAAPQQAYEAAAS
jgi:ribosome-associated protein